MHPRLTTALFSSSPATRRRLRLLTLFCAALLLLLVPGIAAAATPVSTRQSGDNAAGAAVNVGDSSLGQILVDANGMTLYLFDNDEPGKSNCDAACLRRWPPLLADAGTQPVGGSGVSATLGTIQRDDGTTQVTANNMPLYYWFEDKQAGDTLGQAVGDVWWVLAPDGTAIHTAAAGDVTGTETMTDTTATTDTTAMTDTTVTVDTTATSADIITNTNAMTDSSTAASTMDTATSSSADTSAAGSTSASDTSAASDTTSTSGAGDTSSAPQQMPVTGADGGTLSALLAIFGVAAGGGWVALRNRKR